MFGVTEKTLLAMKVLRILSEEGALTAKEMADRLNASYNTLSKACHALSVAKYVKSKRGPSGGYTLIIDLNQLSVADVVEVTDPIPISEPIARVIWNALRELTVREACIKENS